MATQLSSDSDAEFRLVPLIGSEAGDDKAGDDASAGAPNGLPVFDLTSDTPLPDIPANWLSAFASPVAPAPESSAALDAGPRKPGSLWLEGDVLMCGCPDCHAPMSVRLWLMIADCWKCGASIELTEQQEREAKRLLERRERARAAAQANKATTSPATRSPTSESAASATAQSAPPPPTGPATPAAQPKPAPKPAPKPEPAAPDGRQRRASPPAAPPLAPPGPARSQRRISAAENLARRRVSKRRTVGAWLSGLWRDTPAWLVSLVFHLVVLTLLALLTLPADDDSKYITLNALVSKELRRPGQEHLEDPADEVKFDLPVPDDVNLNDQRTREAIVRADQEARELRIVDTADPSMPDLEQVKRKIGRSSGSGVALAARDPRVRVEVLRQEGGTTLTEAAVARGLRWLAQNQQTDGRWRLDGGARSDSAATSLALLPFLGAGQTHLTGRYKDEVAQGVRWLVANQKDDGDLRVGSSGNTGMYAHGQSAIVLCEAFLMTGDEALREPAQKAVDFIAAAQYADGGWRYLPNDEARPHERRSDTSVVGWQLMALQSARAAKLEVPEATMELANHFLDSVQSHDGAQYAYQTGNRATHVMTAEGLLCRIYLGWTLDHPALTQGTQFLLENHPPSQRDANVYYWYYATQAMHHIGGSAWDRWNLQMRDVLVKSQERNGRNAGSWAPKGGHASAGGRVYMTSLSVCTLEVYYRHLPLFRQINLD